MRYRLLSLLGLLLSALLCGCGGGDDGVQQPASGEVLFEPTGSTQTARGVVAFVDENGAPLPVPASGAVVIMGTGSLACAIDRYGLFALLGLPRQTLVALAGALGFLPWIGTVPQGAASLPPGTLRLQRDTNPDDNPAFLQEPAEPRINIGTDGQPRLVGFLPNDNSVLKVFHSGGTALDSFDGAGGVVLETVFGMSGEVRNFQTTLPLPLTTGRLFACLFSADTGFAMSAMHTCDLAINFTVNGRDVAGTVAMPEGVVNAGQPEVIVWEDGNFANNIGGPGGASWTVLTATGSFEGTLPNAPAANAAIHIVVRWKDALGDWHVCAR